MIVDFYTELHRVFFELDSVERVTQRLFTCLLDLIFEFDISFEKVLHRVAPSFFLNGLC